MQVIYDWAQAHFFKCGLKGKDARSYNTCVLFPQPLLPFIKLAMDEGFQKEGSQNLMNCFEATNLARMHAGATGHKTVRCIQSDTNLRTIKLTRQFQSALW